ncbi:lachesin-like isoform X1 [Cydia pomonella]|uniref:lachesin-like isoform X1 n=1 Tax=Cydia pomonella TaxID=82600 RepID=UPI002ADD785A|nr:lachesin-like isoform X1 [Cydia pomonella]XP_061710550.1 lachesin-like isoform X1 [Cydia pomonella]
MSRRCRSFAISVQIITIICQVLTEEPRFAEPIPNVTVALGRDASLPCVVEHLGTYKVAWIHIDRQMILTIHRHVITRLARFSVSHDNAMTWLLHVSQVQQEDRGYYMCQVNTNPMISQVGYLQVVVPPNILDEESTQSAVAVRENQNISLVCKADGFPAPKIMWRREDGQPISVEKRKKVTVYEGDTLSLQRISRTEMGAYLCIATNAVPPSVSKRIIVDVEFSPMIWVPNQLVGAPAGTDVTVDCHTEAHPRAISYWVYDNVMVLPTKKYAINTEENSYRAHMKLTVRNLQLGDFGNYRCISKNSLGETEGSIRLYEIPMPSTSPKATEMKSNANKEPRRANVTRAVQRTEGTERPSVVRAQLDRAPERERDAQHVYRAPPLHVSGTRSVHCWRQPLVAVVILVHIDLVV